MTTASHIGSRVKTAREVQGMTQQQLAEALSIADRQTISEIEKGSRSLKATELISIAETFKLDLEYFYDPFRVDDEAHFSWRADQTVSDSILSQFERRAGMLVGLCRWLDPENGGSSVHQYELPLNEGSSYEDAQSTAERLAKDWFSGGVPGEELVNAIESRLRVPILFVEPSSSGFVEPARISAATCHLSGMNAILVNRNDSATRQNFDIAHELFHVLNRKTIPPQHREPLSVNPTATRVEHLADNFAAALLMPKDLIDSLLLDIGVLDVEVFTKLAGTLHVSYEALAWRLLFLHLIDRDACDEFRGVRSAPVTRPPVRGPLPSYLHGQLSDALRHGKLSMMKAATILGITVDELRDVFMESDLTVS